MKIENDELSLFGAVEDWRKANQMNATVVLVGLCVIAGMLIAGLIFGGAQ